MQVVDRFIIKDNSGCQLDVYIYILLVFYCEMKLEERKGKFCFRFLNVKVLDEKGLRKVCFSSFIEDRLIYTRGGLVGEVQVFMEIRKRGNE